MRSDHILAKLSQLRNETESLTEQSRSMRDVAGIFAESEQRSRTSHRRVGGSEWMAAPYFTANESHSQLPRVAKGRHNYLQRRTSASSSPAYYPDASRIFFYHSIAEFLEIH